MKNLFLLFIVAIYTSCNSSPAKTKVAAKVKSIPVLPASYKAQNSLKQAATDTAINEQEDAYADYFIIVTDTGRNYEDLKRKMIALHKATNIGIDTLGRSYNKTKDLIALPDNDEDEIYAGDYYPRRAVSSTLSLEYLDIYTNNAGPKTIAVVAGIYESKQSADSTLNTMGNIAAHVLKAHIYVGCLH